VKIRYFSSGSAYDLILKQWMQGELICLHVASLWFQVFCFGTANIPIALTPSKITGTPLWLACPFLYVGYHY
jgi:hypothetical protein